MKKPEIWIIQHKDTKAIWKARSGKSSWSAKGAAKCAWAASRRNNGYTYFDKQDEYEVVNLYNYADLEVDYENLKCEHTDLENDYDNLESNYETLLKAYNELHYRMEGFEK
jgi:hypothetical protein